MVDADQPALSADELSLLDAAWETREHAVCPFSGFAVGVVPGDDGGHRFTGANVENASYNLGLCAERVALYHALTHGAGAFVQVVIVTEARELTYPCGACRQALWEFAPRAQVLLANRDGFRRAALRTMLPHAFDASALRDPADPKTR